MASYASAIAQSATIFTGFTTSTVGSITDGNTSGWTNITGTPTAGTYSGAAVPLGTAPLPANIKMPMLAATGARYKKPGGTTGPMSQLSISIKSNGSGNAWYHGCSWARTAPYTAPMRVSGGTIRGKIKRLQGIRFFAEAYDSAGVRQASTSLGSFMQAGGGGGSTTFTITAPTTKAITVPANGYLVLRADIMGATSRSKGSFRLGTGTRGTGLVWTPNEVRAGDPVENRERFHYSDGTPYPDGTKVYEYSSVDMSFTGNVATIGGPPVGPGSTDPNIQPAATGVGEAVFVHNHNDTTKYFYVIPDPASGNVWVANTAYVVGDKVKPSTVSTLYAKVTVAGTSGGTEPAWPTTKGATVVDGTVTWTMVEAETLCTNGKAGYQLGWWRPNTQVNAYQPGPPVVQASRVAPAAPGSYALCTTSGVTGATQPVWPTTWVSGVTTVNDGTAVWTIYDDPTYV